MDSLSSGVFLHYLMLYLVSKVKIIQYVYSVCSILLLHVHDRSTLQFNPVRMSHAGNYTCVAEIPGASSSATLVLRVIPSPTGPIRFAQNPLDLRVQIGESASVDCQPTSMWLSKWMNRKSGTDYVPSLSFYIYPRLLLWSRPLE